MKKAVSVMLAVLMGLAVFAGFAPQTAEADYQLTGIYDQTAARTVTDMINDFRTGGTWYWDEDDTTKIEIAAGELGTLTYDYALEKIAMQRAAEIAVSFSHTRPTGETCFTCTYEGVQPYGENIAAGYETAEAVFIGWREDDQPYDYQGHRRNMLNDRYSAVGIACFEYDGWKYWVQEFGINHSGMELPDPEDGTATVTVETGSGTVEEFIPALQPCELSITGIGFYNAAPGSTASLTVTASGEAAEHGLTYQWYYKMNSDDNYHEIAGATEATYSFTVQREQDGWQFRCLVSNPVSSAFSCTIPLSVDLNAPYITRQPEPVTVSSGETITFSIEAQGENLSYQWYYYKPEDETWRYTVYGAESSVFTMTALLEYSGRRYCCLVKNTATGSSTMSDAVLLTVNSDIRLTAQPQDVSVREGENAVFRVEAEGNVQSYRWYLRESQSDAWQEIADGADGATYTVKADPDMNGYQFMCAVSSDCDTIWSDPATLTVRRIKPVITTQPKNKKVALCKTVKLTVGATAPQGETLTYRWYYRTKPTGSWKKVTSASGATPTLTFKAAAKHHGYQYRCLVRGAEGKVYTDTVTVRIKYGPKITAQPEDTGASAGEKVKLTVKASGKGLKYQWYVRTSSKAKWKKVSGTSGKKATYSFKAASKKNGWQYRCKVSSKYGAVWTDTVKLTVADASYRALLIGEVNFTWDYTMRNQGDAEHMRDMLATVTGPKGAKYKSTVKIDLGYSDVEKAIKTTFAKTKDTDVSLFFIATHGNSDGDGELALIDDTMLDFGTLAGWLSKYVKGDVIVFIESCGAGSAIYKNGASFDADAFTQKAIDAFAAVEEQEANAGVGAMRRSRFYVLAAAAHHEMSWGYEGGDSGNYFTDWLIEGIGKSGKMPADKDGNKIVTLKELHKYIQKYDSYTFQGTYHQHVKAYPASSSYKLFKRK